MAAYAVTYAYAPERTVRKWNIAFGSIDGAE